MSRRSANVGQPFFQKKERHQKKGKKKGKKERHPPLSPEKRKTPTFKSGFVLRVDQEHTKQWPAEEVIERWVALFPQLKTVSLKDQGLQKKLI